MLLALLAVGVAQAQSADQVASNYVNAIGGAAKWKALKSSKQVINLNTQGFDIAGVITSDAQNRTRAELDLNGAKIVQAYDGSTAWWINPFQGVTAPAKMPEQVAKEVRDQEFLNDLIDYKKRGSTLTLEGEETVEGTACYKLKLVKKSATEIFYFVNKETNLMFMTRTTSEAQGFKQTVDSFFSGYEEVNGLMAPTKVVAKSAGVVQRTTTVKSVEYNVAVSDDIFAFPGN